MSIMVLANLAAMEVRLRRSFDCTVEMKRTWRSQRWHLTLLQVDPCGAAQSKTMILEAGGFSKV
jgi:hypothetical protein